MQASIFKNLKVLLKKFGYTQETFAQKIEVSRVSVSHWLRGVRTPSFDSIKKMAEIFSMDPDEFLNYLKKPPITNKELLNTDDDKKINTEINKIKIPEFAIYDWSGIRNITNERHKYVFGLIVNNDAMTPRDNSLGIRAGEIIVVDLMLPPQSGSYVIAKVDDSYVLRKYIVDGPYKFLEPLNPSYQKIKINENVEIIGVVATVIRKV